MPADLANFINNYGYLGIFLIVFSEEIGFPNPVPNELNILFAGSLAYSGLLSLPLVFFTIVAADFLGAAVWYFIFYFFGGQLLTRVPRWLPVQAIQGFKARISKKRRWLIFLGRLISYGRKYIPMAAGLIRVPAKIFLEMSFWSSVVWVGVYLLVGWLLGPSWQSFIAGIGITKFILIGAVIMAVIFVVSLIKFELFRKEENIKTSNR